jgi:PKD repeat protein
MKKLLLLLSLTIVFLFNSRSQDIGFDVDVDYGCAPLTVTFTNTSTDGTYFGWDFGFGDIALVYDTTITFEEAGNYAVMMMAVDEYGNTLGMHHHEINVLGTYFTSSLGDTICPGEKIEFYAQGVYNWLEWDFGTGIDAQDEYTVDHAFFTPGQYTVTLNGESECGVQQYSKTIYVTPNAVPLVDIYTDSPTRICVGDEIFLESGYKAASYFWNFDDGETSTKKSPSHAFYGLGSKMVTLTVTNKCNNTATDTINIQVREDVEANANYAALPDPVCPGEVIGFYGMGAGDYIWDFGDGQTGTGHTVHYMYADTGTYSVTCYVENGCGSSETNTQTISVNADTSRKPEVFVYFDMGNHWDSDTVTVCPGEEVIIKNFSWEQNNVKFHWEMGDGTSYDSRDASHSYSSAGVFQIEMIATNDCMGSDTAYKWVNVDDQALPSAELAIIPTTICPGEKIYFFDEDSDIEEGNYLYSVWFGDGDSIFQTNSYNDPYVPTLSHVYNEAGSYNYIFTVENLCGNDLTQEGIITVQESADVEAFYYITNSTLSDNEYDPATASCPGDSVAFVIAGGMDYEWHFGEGGTSTHQSPVYAYADTGNYEAYCIATNGCGRIDTIYTEVVVSDTVKPLVWFEMSQEVFCMSDTIQFEYADYGMLSNNYSFFWDFDDGSTSTEKNPKHKYEKGGDKFVKLVVTNGCTSDSIFRHLIVANPKVDFYVDQNSIMPGTLVQFSNNTQGGISFEWQFGDGTTSTAISPAHTYDEYGLYDVTLIAHSAMGCKTIHKKEGFIQVHNMEVSSYDIGHVSCFGHNDGYIDIAVTGGTPPYDFNWEDGSDEQDRYDLGAGSYFLEIKDSEGITISGEFNITEPDDLYIEVYPEPEICGNDGYIEGYAEGGTPPYSVIWDDGSTEAIRFNMPPGYYMATITDANGCSYEDEAEIMEAYEFLDLDVLYDVQYTACETYDGVAIAVPSGGSGDYAYYWSDEMEQTNDTAFDLYAGVYEVYVEDLETGCWDSTLAFIENYGGHVINYIYSEDQRCPGLNDSRAVASVSGTGIIEVEWDTDPPVYDTLVENLAPGWYAFYATDENGCTTSYYTEVEAKDSIDLIWYHEDPLCYGDYSGWAWVELENIDTNRVYTYAWSNGSEEQQIQNRNAGTYTITVYDSEGCTISESITLNDPPEMTIDIFTSDVTFYGANDGVIDITVNNGIPPYSYYWDNDEDTQDLVNMPAGTYYGTVWDDNGCEVSGEVTLNEPDPLNPEITADGPITFCDGGSVVLDAGEGYKTYVWNTGDSTQTIVADTNMIYYVMVTSDDSYGIDSMFVNVIYPYADQEICMVTVDTSSGYNLVVWEETENEAIVSYNIYKESTTLHDYQLIGSVNYGELTVFEDTNSNPKQKSDRYKISIVDTCGNESGLSEAHKTMHLTVSTGVGVYNLIWENYEGFDFGSYIIYRGQTEDELFPVGSIQSDFTTYTDYQPIGLYYYQIAVVKDDTCLNVSGGNKLQSGPFSSSFSNLDDNAYQADTSGISELDASILNLKIYPNPFNDVAHIQFDNPKGVSYTLMVKDMSGRVISQFDNITSDHFDLHKGGLPSGYYIVDMIGEKRYIGRVIIE